MRRRIDIAASILNTPDLLFLDEPTTGLDPRSRNQVWDIVRAVVAHGTTVLLTTQYLDEADQLAGRIAVDRPRQGDRGGHPGRAEGVGRRRHRPRAAARPGAAARGASGCSAGRSACAVQLDADPVALTARVGERRHRRSAPASRPRGRWPSWPRAGIVVDNFSLGQPSLDEVFLALTDHPAGRPTSADDAAGGSPMSDTTTDHDRRSAVRLRPVGRGAGDRCSRPVQPTAPAERAVGVADLRLAGRAEDQARARSSSST